MISLLGSQLWRVFFSVSGYEKEANDKNHDQDNYLNQQAVYYARYQYYCSKCSVVWVKAKISKNK